MNKNYEVRIEEDGSIWVNLDEMINIFTEMKSDQDEYISKIGEFAAYTLDAFKKKSINNPDKIMMSKTFSGTPE